MRYFAAIPRSVFLRYLLVVWFGIPLLAVHSLLWAGDVIHFAVGKPSYDAQIASLPAKPPRIKIFTWGGMLFTWEDVIYDETDQTALPLNQRAQDWKQRPESTEINMCNIDPLWDHYYLGHCGD